MNDFKHNCPPPVETNKMPAPARNCFPPGALDSRAVSCDSLGMNVIAAAAVFYHRVQIVPTGLIFPASTGTGRPAI